MSAWIVSRAHIDALVQGLGESELVTRHPDEVGRALWAECLKSVAYRYPNDGDGERPGPINFRDADVTTYTYRRPTAKLTRHDLLDAAQCWAYQSSEHPDFHDGEPWKWIAGLVQRLKDVGAESEPGINAWGLDEEHVHGQLAEKA